MFLNTTPATPDQVRNFTPHVYDAVRREGDRVLEVDVFPWGNDNTLDSKRFRPAPGDNAGRQPQRFPWNIPPPRGRVHHVGWVCRCGGVCIVAVSWPEGKI